MSGTEIDSMLRAETEKLSPKRQGGASDSSAGAFGEHALHVPRDLS